ncbi:MAG: hypothetical protein ABF755_08190 [Oenococcus oeni]
MIIFLTALNSILLNHPAYFLFISTPANRLVIKYRNAYLGSILIQSFLVAEILIVSGIQKDKLSNLLLQLNNHRIVVSAMTQQLIQFIGLSTVIFLTILTIIFCFYLPKINKNDLF